MLGTRALEVWSRRHSPYSPIHLEGERLIISSSSGFFLFASFSFFRIACGNVGNSRAVAAGPDYELIPRAVRWLQGDFRIRPKPGAQRMLRCCPARTRL